MTAVKKAPKASIGTIASNIGESILDSLGEVPVSKRRKSRDARVESRAGCR